MKKIYIVLLFAFIVVGCSTKTLPTKEISNAKVALAKLDLSDAKKYYPKESEEIKRRYLVLKKLMADERYRDAKFLAQEIVADYRVLEIKTKKRSLKNRLSMVDDSSEEIESLESSGE